MSETMQVTEFNSLTGETIIRDMSSDELAQRKLDVAEAKAQEAEATAKADARISALAKLAKLGLTKAEIEAL